LQTDSRIAINLAGASLQDSGVGPSRTAEHVDGADRARLRGLDGVTLGDAGQARLSI
jgi:hypothetical protein